MNKIFNSFTNSKYGSQFTWLYAFTTTGKDIKVYNGTTKLKPFTKFSTNDIEALKLKLFCCPSNWERSVEYEKKWIIVYLRRAPPQLLLFSNMQIWLVCT